MFSNTDDYQSSTSLTAANFTITTIKPSTHSSNKGQHIANAMDRNEIPPEFNAPPYPIPSAPASQSNNISNPLSFNFNDESDETLARRLQMEENVAAASVYMDERRSEKHAREIDLEHPVGANSSSTASRLNQEKSDLEFAKNLQNINNITSSPSNATDYQSDADHITAMQLQEQEHQTATQARENQHNSRAKCWTRKIFKMIIVSSFLVIGGFLAFMFGPTIWEKSGGNRNDLSGVFSDNWGSDVEEDDDIGGQTNYDEGDYAKWRRKDGYGLDLTIVNGLNENWNKYFNQAIADWNKTDALFLTAKTDPNGPNCDEERGVMKVCNDFFGRTGWTGLNEVYFENGRIVQSIAKMNENYLSNAQEGERQYVMCHEIGHGFGLPHRDESVLNADLGTCMDYVRIPENNQKPDDIDFSNLVTLYGTKYNRRSRNLSTKQSETDVTKSVKTLSSKNMTYKDGTRIFASENMEVYKVVLDNDVTILTSLVLKR